MSLLTMIYIIYGLLYTTFGLGAAQSLGWPGLAWQAGQMAVRLGALPGTDEIPNWIGLPSVPWRQRNEQTQLGFPTCSPFNGHRRLGVRYQVQAVTFPDS